MVLQQDSVQVRRPSNSYVLIVRWHSEEAKEHKPKVVFVDDENKIVKVSSYEKYGTLTQEAAK